MNWLQMLQYNNEQRLWELFGWIIILRRIWSLYKLAYVNSFVRFSKLKLYSFLR